MYQNIVLPYATFGTTILMDCYYAYDHVTGETKYFDTWEEAKAKAYELNSRYKAKRI